MINSFDCDGVITLGLYPGPDDVIITGRSYEEREVTKKYLENKNIKNEVFFSNNSFNNKTRIKSGIHKGNTIVLLCKFGREINIHFDDDIVQINEIRRIIKQNNIKTKVVFVDHNGLEELENVRRDEFGKVIK